MRYRFTDKEIDQISKSIVILIDTREQNNSHIKQFLDSKQIGYKVKKLDFGDYSCMLPKGTFRGQERDIYFDRDIVIERKNSIDEIAGNFKDDGIRLKTELAHLNKYGIKYYFFVEDPNYDINIRQGNYRSQYDPKALYNRIKKSIEIRYNTFIRPIDKSIIGSEIYNTFESYVYDLFKHKWFGEEKELEICEMAALDILYEDWGVYYGKRFNESKEKIQWMPREK